MGDSPHRSSADDRAGAGLDRGSVPVPPGAPRWVKVAALIVGVLILLVVIAQLTGLGGDHGPGRHVGADSAALTGIAQFDARSSLVQGHQAPAPGSYS